MVYLKPTAESTPPLSSLLSVLWQGTLENTKSLVKEAKDLFKIILCILCVPSEELKTW